jgi:hydroxymethylbilane synthase
MTPLKLGTRGSRLAMAQSQQVADAITAATGRPVVLEVVSTRGDRDRTRPLSELGGKGLFTFELEEGLRQGTLDFAVHSLKDLPTDDPDGLVVAAFPEREDPRDVFVGPALTDLRDGAVVGSGSLRRRAQFRAMRPDVELVDIRGNVETRIGKVDNGTVEGTILAMAGLNRLGIARPDLRPISIEQMVPAVGQGALGIQCRAQDPDVQAVLATIDHPATRRCVTAERAFLSTYGGGCNVPAACHVREESEGLYGIAIAEDASGTLRRVEARGTDAEALGKQLAELVRA